jgi:hypothetical protein
MFHAREISGEYGRRAGLLGAGANQVIGWTVGFRQEGIGIGCEIAYHTLC